MHQQRSIVYMGIFALPAPRITAETECAKARAKKKSETQTSNNEENK